MEHLFWIGRLYVTTENTQKSCSCGDIGTENYKNLEKWYVSYYYWSVRYKRTLLLYWPGNSASPRATIVLIVVAAAVISLTVHGSLQITDNEYPLMHYTKLISEEHFTVERSLVTVLPLAEEDSANKEAGCLIEELHTSGRWPVLVYNVSCTCHAVKSLQEPWLFQCLHFFY